MLKLIFVVATFTAAYAHNKGAVYLVDPTGNSHVVGSATFEEVNGGVHIKGEVRGLNPGNHGFHFHSLGNIANGCLGTASHFNPHNQNHGSPQDHIRHIGDLGNIVADSNGVAKIDLFDNVISLHGPNSIIGRAAVVHEKTDDLGKGGNADSLKTGNAGGRLACGVIGIN